MQTRYRIFYGLALAAGSLLLGGVLAGPPGAGAAPPAGVAPVPPAPGAVQASSPLTNCLTWRVVPGADAPNSDSDLRGVAAVTANDMWAVGSSLDENFYMHTLTEHWDGSTWTQVASPDPGLANNLLFAVAAPAGNDAWAVGWKANTNIPQPLFLHWNGTAWSESEQTINRPQVVLFSISAVAANDIWAVGRSCETPQCLRRVTAILHYDGTAWTDVASPNPGE
jgi:hypothetical protein